MWAALEVENAGHEADLKNSGHDVEEQGAEHEVDATSAAIDRFRQTARAPSHVIGKVEGVKVKKNVSRNLSDGVHCDLERSRRGGRG